MGAIVGWALGMTVGDGEGFAPEQTELPDESEQAFSSSPIPQRLGGFELQSMEA